MMKVLQFLLFSASFVALGPIAQADVITGRVVDSLGAGVPGVDIDVDNLGGGGDPDIFNDGTDLNGFFTTTLPAGFYDIIFHPPAAPASSSLALVLEGTVVVGTIDLGTIVLPPGVVVSGRALTMAGVPVASINLDVTDLTTGDDLLLTAGTTNAFGTFAVAAPAGPIEVRFNTNPVVGPTLAHQQLELSPSADTDLGDIVFVPGFDLSATVIGPAAQPVQGVDIDVFDAATGDKLYTPGDNTSGSGFVSVVVPAGSFDFAVCPTVSTGLVAAELTGVSVLANTQLGNIQLQAGHVLSGTVINTLSQPVPGVDIDVAFASTGQEIALCSDNTNGAGHYAVVVPSGSWTLNFDPNFNVPYAETTQSPVGVASNTIVNATLPDCPFHVPYGTGLAGTGGVTPTLGSTGGSPRLGNASYAIELADARGGALSFLVVGLVPANTPLLGGTLLVSGELPERGGQDLSGVPQQHPPLPGPASLPTFITPVRLSGPAGVAGAGSASLPLAVPNNPSIAGLSHYVQFVVNDPAAPQGWAFSHAIQITYCE